MPSLPTRIVAVATAIRPARTSGTVPAKLPVLWCSETQSRWQTKRSAAFASSLVSCSAWAAVPLCRIGDWSSTLSASSDIRFVPCPGRLLPIIRPGTNAGRGRATQPPGRGGRSAPFEAGPEQRAQTLPGRGLASEAAGEIVDCHLHFRGTNVDRPADD